MPRAGRSRSYCGAPHASLRPTFFPYIVPFSEQSVCGNTAQSVLCRALRHTWPASFGTSTPSSLRASILQHGVCRPLPCVPQGLRFARHAVHERASRHTHGLHVGYAFGTHCRLHVCVLHPCASSADGAARRDSGTRSLHALPAVRRISSLPLVLSAVRSASVALSALPALLSVARETVRSGASPQVRWCPVSCVAGLSVPLTASRRVVRTLRAVLVSCHRRPAAAPGAAPLALCGRSASGRATPGTRRPRGVECVPCVLCHCSLVAGLPCALSLCCGQAARRRAFSSCGHGATRARIYRAAPSSCFRRHTGDSAAQSEGEPSRLRAACRVLSATTGLRNRLPAARACQRSSARPAPPAAVRHQGRATARGKGTGLCGEACPVHARTAQFVIGNGGNARFADRAQRAGERSRTRVAGTGRREAFPRARSLGRGGKTLSATMGGAGESTLGGSEGKTATALALGDGQ
ncbi:hypothetical protein ERJ75_000692500 [Trypanosoma vivax]|nr:hypothetical protein ERJ75_000692500 [Trypanosoma vivax]